MSIKIANIIPDGNCLYRSIALALYNDQNLYKNVKEVIAKYVILNGKNKFNGENTTLEDWIIMDGHKNQSDFLHMLWEGTYGGALEVAIASVAINHNIYIYDLSLN